MEHPFRDETLVPKRKSILFLVEFVVDDKPDPSVFVQEIDSINKGVFDNALGRDVNTSHDPFVDDTLMGDICCHVLTCMAASIGALFIVMGQLDEENNVHPLGWKNTLYFLALKNSLTSLSTKER